MKIDISRDVLLAPLTKQVTITERKSIMPILSNVLVDLTKSGISLYSTDLELSAISHIKYEGAADKKIVVHGRKFLDIIKEMDPDVITFEVKENTLTLTQKQSEFVLGLQDSEEFPEIKEITGTEQCTIDGGTLLEMLEKVQFAISSDETRYVLTGMYMTASDGMLSIVGTDGFRMALYRKKIDGLENFKGVIVPKASAKEFFNDHLLTIDVVQNEEKEYQDGIEANPPARSWLRLPFVFPLCCPDNRLNSGI